MPSYSMTAFDKGLRCKYIGQLHCCML